ncbi:site-2 protease family protein [Candidatus Poribacteria bacterium]|nr:site-2 protease family protein [Candidatus Poribacteria bacterium]
MPFSPDAIWNAILIVTQFIILLTFHEWGHAKSANMLGDPTAKDLGRMSLNPAVHIDPIGTLMLPLIGSLSSSLFGGASRGMFFGWAKPVPVDPYNLRNPRRDLMLIAAAGPFMNIVLTFAIFFIIAGLKLVFDVFDLKTDHGDIYVQIYFFLNTSAQISVFLAVFNMLPLFPLDGFSVVNGLLPERASREFSKLAPYGMPILMALIFLPFVLPIGSPLSFLGDITYFIFSLIRKIVDVIGIL